MLLPVALNVANWPCLIVGGGAVAARKARALLECEARVRVIAPELAAEFAPGIEHLARLYQPGDCEGFRLVVAATNAREVNEAVRREANQVGALCNAADDPESSDFHTSAVVRRGDVAIGISTGGHSPVLSKHLKERVESVIGPEYARLIELVSELDFERGAGWRAVLSAGVLELLRDGREDEARAVLESLEAGS